MNEDPVPCGTRPIHVLYVHHSGVFGGASRSLIELIDAFPPGSVRTHAIVQRGAVPAMLKDAGVEVLETRGITQFDCTAYGCYRGLRWLILCRELYYLPFTIAALVTAWRRWPDIDLVHINDTTPVVAIALAGRLFRAPVVVHARALLARRAIPRRMRWLTRLLRRRAQQVIAIDETVRATLPAQIDALVVHNGFAPGLGPKAPPPPAFANLSPASLKIAMVGSLSAMKGVYEFIEAASVIVRKGLAVDFIFVGADIRPLRGLRGWLLRVLGFARPVRAELERMVAERGVAAHVHFIGFTSGIKAVYDNIDVICFPSHLDAPGRPVFEAAFSGVPSIVAIREPKPDTMVDGRTGICVPARDPQALVVAIERLYYDRDALKRMGEHARALARANFDVRRNALEVLEVYRKLLRHSDAKD